MQTLVHASQPRSIAHQTAPLRIVALGDSLIYGFGDPEGGGWVERLRRQWMQPDSAGHAVYNLGIRGDRLSQVGCRLEAEFRNRGELRHRQPDLIILSVGVNDSARLGSPNARNFTDFSLFQADLTHLLDRACQLCPVLFVGMTPVDESRMPFAEALYYSHADQHRYKEATRIACAACKIPYLDVFEQWIEQDDWRSRLSADGLHPNVKGYTALLQDFLNWDAIAPYIH